MKNAYLFFFLLFFSFPVFGLESFSTIEHLQKHGEKIVSLQGEFVQSLKEKGNSIRSFSGYFLFQRPNKVRICYSRPHEQLVVTDGKTIWYHRSKGKKTKQVAWNKVYSSERPMIDLGFNLEDIFLRTDFQSKKVDNDCILYKDGISLVVDTQKWVVKHLKINHEGKLLAEKEYLNFRRLEDDIWLPTEKIERISSPSGIIETKTTFKKLVVNPELKSSDFKFQTSKKR